MIMERPKAQVNEQPQVLSRRGGSVNLESRKRYLPPRSAAADGSAGTPLPGL